MAFENELARLSIGFIGTLVVGVLDVHHTHWLKVSASVPVESIRLYEFCLENGFRQLVKRQRTKMVTFWI